MKKAFFLLGFLILIFSSVLNAHAAAGDASLATKVCSETANELRVTIEADASNAISAVELVIKNLNCTPTGKEEFPGDVNLSTELNEDTTDGSWNLKVLSGKVGFWDSPPSVNLYRYWCDVTGDDIGISFLDTEVISSTNEEFNVQKGIFLKNISDIEPCTPPPPPAPVCGDGTKDANEACDDGNTLDGDGCSANCGSDETCGNNILDPISGEACDGGASCSSTCELIPVADPGTDPDTLVTYQQPPGPDTTGDGSLNGLNGANILPEPTGDVIVTVQEDTVMHGAPDVLEAQPVQFRDAAGLQETGPKETALFIMAASAALAWTFFRFRKSLFKIQN